MATAQAIERLQYYETSPNTKIGQHILFEPEWLNFIASQADSCAHVIEIGAGPGNLTEYIARCAQSVTAIELDRRYEPMLLDLQCRYSNVSVVYGNALTLDLAKLHKTREQTLQIIANIPYHIIEPLMGKLMDVPMEYAVMTVGKKSSSMVRETDPSHSDFTRLSLMAMGFFDVSLLAQIPKSAFYPVPRTESEVIRITPKSKADSSDPTSRVIQELFRRGDSSSLGNIIRTALQNISSEQRMRSKRESHRHDRRETHRMLSELTRPHAVYHGVQDDDMQENTYGDPLSQLKIPTHLLTSRFSSLNNDDLRILTQAILQSYPNQ